MSKGMNYRFRVRPNDGRLVAKPHIRRRKIEYDKFSSPERYTEDSNSHVIIMRPSFKSLEGAALKYLNEFEKPKVKTKKKF